jgi:H+/Cl- antiporter ClcA
MLSTIFRVASGCLILYLVGLVTNRASDLGYKAPKLIALLCGKRKPILSVPGVAVQMMAIGYLLGTIFAEYLKREDLIVGLGMAGLFSVSILIGLIWAIWYMINK